MDNKKNKLLAENYLFTAASRFFEEPDCVELAQMNESKKLDEKRMQITDPDTGKSFFADVPDSVLYQAKLADYASEEMGEEDFTTAAEPAVLAKRTAVAKANNAAKFAPRVEAGASIFAKFKPEIDKIIKDAAKDAFDSGALTFNGKSWRCPGINKILKQLEHDIFLDVIKPQQNVLKKDYPALRAAYFAYIGHPSNIGGNTGLEDLEDKFLTAADDVKNEPEADDVKNEPEVTETAEFEEAFHRACNDVLAEQYATRYNVTLNEAIKMFIVDDIH
jgi:hypothetical protein